MCNRNAPGVFRHKIPRTVRPLDKHYRAARKIILPPEGKDIVRSGKTIEIHVHEQPLASIILGDKTERRRRHRLFHTDCARERLRKRGFACAEIAFKADHVSSAHKFRKLAGDLGRFFRR